MRAPKVERKDRARPFVLPHRLIRSLSPLASVIPKRMRQLRTTGRTRESVEIPMHTQLIKWASMP